LVYIHEKNKFSLIMIGDLLYEGKGKLVGIRLLNAEEYKIEHAVIEEGKFQDMDVTILGTFWTIPAGKNVTHVEGQGIITTIDNEDTANISRVWNRNF
jgi:hypothetical protein